VAVPAERARKSLYQYRSTSLINNRPPSEDRHELRHSPAVESYGVAVSYERGTSVVDCKRQDSFAVTHGESLGRCRANMACIRQIMALDF